MNVPDQLCYIPCNFCNIVLAVSVPCSCLFDVVTVRCGHCTNLWTVNMAAAFQWLQQQNAQILDISNPSYSPTSQQPESRMQGPIHSSTELKVDVGSSSKWNNKLAIQPSITKKPEPKIANRPPEKRQRVPSAYNQFIKEEIQRIKANNPEITHREAFSTAAKNWAHFPHIHFGLMLESNNHVKHNEGSEKNQMRRAAIINK